MTHRGATRNDAVLAQPIASSGLSKDHHDLLQNTIQHRHKLTKMCFKSRIVWYLEASRMLLKFIVCATLFSPSVGTQQLSAERGVFFADMIDQLNMWLSTCLVDCCNAWL